MNDTVDTTGNANNSILGLTWWWLRRAPDVLLDTSGAYVTMSNETNATVFLNCSALELAWPANLFDGGLVRARRRRAPIISAAQAFNGSVNFSLLVPSFMARISASLSHFGACSALCP